MKLATIAEHTIDIDRLTEGGWVLDAGCRDFGFSRGLAGLGCKVLALDADPTIDNPGIDGVRYVNYAIAAAEGRRTLVMTSDPQARHLVPPGHGVSGPIARVEARTIDQLSSLTGVSLWDAVKLDVEGSEYNILKAWPGPIAKQISIEFHEHCMKVDPNEYELIFKHLGQWYDVVQHMKEARHCCAPNYWDSLLVLRG